MKYFMKRFNSLKKALIFVKYISCGLKDYSRFHNKKQFTLIYGSIEPELKLIDFLNSADSFKAAVSAYFIFPVF